MARKPNLLTTGPVMAVAFAALSLSTSPVAAEVTGGAPVAGPTQVSPYGLALLNRITWGETVSGVTDYQKLGEARWLERQLHPSAEDRLPPEAQVQIDALPISHTPMIVLVADLEAQNKAANALTDPDQKKAAKDAYNKALNDLGRQAATRSLLRDIYSPNQLQEQMTWFWFNHFNVHLAKRDIRTMVGDYEDQAIRPRALGRFRTLLEATLRHPAMLRYLDNDQNAVGHINENYAREIMELHTLGVGSGYTQKDVQELARILTGVGVNATPNLPSVRPELRSYYGRAGMMEFNPNRHDFGDKVFLGHVIRGSGFPEVEQALDILAREPATAHHVSFQIAQYFMGDAPPPAVVDRMAATFQKTDGDIAQVLSTLFHSPEFNASLGKTFKDPMHYAISAVRLAYDDRVILNTGPIQGWLNRMAEGLYNHETPDGYPMTSAAWSGPGQFAVRFEIARQIGAGSAGLFKPDGQGAVDHPGFPVLQNALFYEGLGATLAQPTQASLNQSLSPQDWNTLFLSSPEFMRR
jgi:uncharacterized protein (DUF1800 family)